MSHAAEDNGDATFHSRARDEQDQKKICRQAQSQPNRKQYTSDLPPPHTHFPWLFRHFQIRVINGAGDCGETVPGTI
jgi:hypothetical protein